MTYLTLTQLVTQIEEDIANTKFSSHGGFREMRRSLQLLDQPQNKKPAIIVTKVYGEEHYQVVKSRLSEYFDSAFYKGDETPPALKIILDSLERDARFSGLQDLYHKETEGNNQFVVVRPWMDNFKKNYYWGKTFTIVFYEIPKKYDGSKTTIASGVGDALVKAGIIT